jgi:hypothetical protein
MNINEVLILVFGVATLLVAIFGLMIKLIEMTRK